MKRGRLSQDEKNYIVSHPKQSVKKIAQHLDRTEAIVQKTRDQLTQLESPKEPSKVRTLMPNKSAGGREGVVIMTKEASEVIDEAKKNNVVTNRHTEGSIFRPQG